MVIIAGAFTIFMLDAEAYPSTNLLIIQLAEVVSAEPSLHLEFTLSENVNAHMIRAIDTNYLLTFVGQLSKSDFFRWKCFIKIKEIQCWCWQLSKGGRKDLMNNNKWTTFMSHATVNVTYAENLNAQLCNWQYHNYDGQRKYIFCIELNITPITPSTLWSDCYKCWIIIKSDNVLPGLLLQDCNSLVLSPQHFQHHFDGNKAIYNVCLIMLI